MNVRLALVAVMFGACAIGCEGQTGDDASSSEPKEATETAAPRESVAKSRVTKPATVEVEQVAETTQSDDSTDVSDKEKTYWMQVTEMYENAKSSGKTTASNVNAWIIETYDQASTSTKETATETADWFNNAYLQAKESGETTAANTRDWLIEDVRKMGSCEYKTITAAPTDIDGALEQLNEVGSERWECFFVDRQGSQTVFYLKKPGRSFLRQLPARELLHLLPLLNKDKAD